MSRPDISQQIRLIVSSEAIAAGIQLTPNAVNYLALVPPSYDPEAIMIDVDIRELRLSFAIGFILISIAVALKIINA